MKRIVLSILSICLSLNISAQASGGQIKRNHATAKKNSLKKNSSIINDGMYKNMSLEHLEKLANQDDIIAEYYLACRYYQKENYDTAFYWYNKAASQDFLKAQVKLAECYYHGKGTYRNIHMAETWLKYAANNGSKEAKERLEMWFNIK